MSRVTRKDLVLGLLREHLDDWVNGPEICSPAVGGSEGLRRVRELREDGFPIVMRRHPDRRRAVRQYKLRNDSPLKVVNIDHARNIWVQGYYRTKEAEVGFERWVAFNHSFGPWYRLQDERNGMSRDLSSGGRNVSVVVMPDMSKVRWYWTVKFFAYNPKNSRGKNQPLPEATLHGIELTLELAQEKALEAFRRGRPAAGISGTSVEAT